MPLQPTTVKILQPGSMQWRKGILGAQQVRRPLQEEGQGQALWWGPQLRPQEAQGTYVMVLPVSTMTANCLGGVPRCRVA